ncbi:sigma 54-interacting transcriptional regulator [Humisphaera borealis]|uniref:Sigma 54-interacting transcriptional regulator n=1 Tax=Humisphaera borealis TaxID=2807512 RepID=A0A7M2X2S4_9BACT|nr:sigma 54-interacting transcriptional regulator [Humisphaera borealis]QOV91331.1 sigma 54-interacting transcriptional regulator [Humisphaera borealis]
MNQAPEKRSDYELSVLTEIGQILSSTIELRQAFAKVMQLVSEKVNMHRGALVLLDESTGRLRTEAAVGLTPDEIERGKYALGEGVTGNVVATGRPRIIADLRNDPDFLNRTGRLAHDSGPISFICVPIRIEGRTAGALSVDKPFESDEQLRSDLRLIDIIGAFLAQAIQLNRMVLRQKEVLIEENAQLRAQIRDRFRFENIIGDSPAMHDVFATVAQVANSRATVLLLGETGTGKEMIAKAIHYNSPRRDKPFVRVNCGALTGTLLESELFGHVKGSFTGAIRDKEGRFEVADQGTIFLDEIGTMEPHLQVKLLRVLQEREFERVGDTQTMKVDVRVVAATNVDLQEEVAKDNFREDLFYRLNVCPIYLPPLRNRREDIPPLIDHFLDKYNTVNGRSLRRISRDMLNVLMRYPWPGNVRELENAIERAVVLSTTEDFSEDLLPLSVRMFAAQRRTNSSSESIETLTRRLADQAMADYEMREGEIYKLVTDQLEMALIDRALARCGGVKTKAADFLGINRNTLNKKVKDLGIEAAE